MVPTIYDVAKRAGVGIGTVSRAINDSPQIRPETKKRVLQAIQDLGYSPHTMAKRLARRQIGILAAMMPFYTGHFYQELLRGMQKSLSEFEYDLILYYVDKPSKLSGFLDRTLKEKRCDGVLIISMDIPDEYVEKFTASHLPLVIVDRFHKDVDCIQVENERGAYLATQYLIGLGHRRIGMIAGNKHSEPAKQRYQGYRRALAEARILLQSEWYVSADMLGSDLALLQNDGFNELAGRYAMEKILSMKRKRPTAVFASSDIQAFGAMKAVADAHLKIPEDVALIGFDDIELADYMALTTMQQPMYDMGKLAIERMMEKIEKKDTGIRQIRLDTHLIERKTTRA